MTGTGTCDRKAYEVLIMERVHQGKHECALDFALRSRRHQNQDLASKETEHLQKIQP